MPLLEEWSIPSRLASAADLPGCFEGPVTELARAWLGSLEPTELAQVEIVSCGPARMLEASISLARRFGLPCQVSPDA
jgi:dihydroorotate dehydrogenase electron transfer subunit